ncbi:protein kinase domain-containing protein [Nitratifractor sp.]
MSKQNIEASGFTLAKGIELKGDDFFEVKVMDEITVAAVCDGVGSASHGAEAAERTCHFLLNALKNRPRSWSMEKSIKHFIQNINRLLYTESMTEYGGPELVTTLALAVIEGDRLYGANVGDSRIYLLRDGELTRLSSDHAMEEEGMEHVLTQAIGLEEGVEPYYFENNLRAKDRLLLCSDGLYNELSEEELAEGMGLNASFLVKKASKKYDDKLPDDTTAVLLTIKELDPRLQYKQSELAVRERYKKGEVIDGYRLLRPLIQNGRTWLCEKRGQRYVLKFAPYEVLEDEKILDLYVKEVWNAKRLKAGFFPKAAVPTNRTHRYYIMPYLEGTELKKEIAKRPLPTDLAIDLGEFLLRMSQYLIRQDLVHGDIKPENILVTERKGKKSFKMLDFGSITEVYSDSSRAGTPSYLAPERFHGAPISEQSEVYAIGVTLYEALSRRFPYGEIEPFQTPSFEKSPKPLSQLNPNVPKWLESVVMRAVEADPDKRYSHYSEMLYELQHPEKVRPYFSKESSLVERYPLPVCRWLLLASLIANVVLLTR